MENTSELPMLAHRLYSEQINVKVELCTKQRAQLLKGYGVDTAQLFRDLITKAIDDALSKIENRAS